MVNLPDQLVSALFVLSMVPAPFTADIAEPVLALADTRNERVAVLRRLATLGFLCYNASLQQYSMHKMIRDAAQLLLHNLGECISHTGQCPAAEECVPHAAIVSEDFGDVGQGHSRGVLYPMTIMPIKTCQSRPVMCLW